MSRSNSPFRIWIRTSSYCSLASLALVCYLFATSTSSAQYLMTVVIAVLLLLLSVCIGFYFGIQRYHDKQQRDFMHSALNNHYPQRDLFERRAALAKTDQRATVKRVDTFA